MSRQKTIKKPVSVEAPGLFSGKPSRLRFMPAGPDHGVLFVRDDLPGKPSLAPDVAHLSRQMRRTSLVNSNASIDTIEHVMSAIYGLGIDNLIVEVNSEETPSTDGSPQPFVDALQQAGIAEQDALPKICVIEDPVAVSAGDAMLAALPGPTDCLDILYDLDYSQTPSIGRQVLAFRLGKDDYVSQIAPARTFLLEAEATAFQAQGLGTHLTPEQMLVMGNDGPLAPNSLRFVDEHVRHKIADLIGDLGLLGRRLRGRIVAYKSGHELNQMLVRRLAAMLESRNRAKSVSGEPVMDIRNIMRLLPHRYPFLMVDRVIEIDGDRRAVGIKNVSINEPFFQGHYPAQPIMPGVLILEALAQISGILLSRRLEHTGKVAMLLSMDRVKLRRAVRPGDQLVLEAQTLHVRTRTGHCRCRAYVGADVAAEAEIKFMLVDAEPAPGPTE